MARVAYMAIIDNDIAQFERTYVLLSHFHIIEMFIW